MWADLGLGEGQLNGVTGLFVWNNRCPSETPDQGRSSAELALDAQATVAKETRDDGGVSGKIRPEALGKRRKNGRENPVKVRVYLLKVKRQKSAGRSATSGAVTAISTDSGKVCFY